MSKLKIYTLNCTRTYLMNDFTSRDRTSWTKSAEVVVKYTFSGLEKGLVAEKTKQLLLFHGL